ncbi:unnamed protein product [Schistocephalus solidus]|uniref:C2H2-type domain-containing protein n=1 Tax=Schistocephalus solidus TaxID=70667 RepID=A0A183TKG6_SCHSO|nr:unnamed protein product [Schistocephalus solidus]
MPKPCQRPQAVGAHSVRESAWSNIFELDATSISQPQPLPCLPQTPRLRPPQSMIATSSMPLNPRSPTPSSLLHPSADRGDKHHLPHSHHLSSHLRLPSPATSTDTTTTTTPSTSDGDSVLTCPHCDRTFTSRIGLVVHLRIHHTETGELVPGAPTHSETAASNALSSLAHSLIAWACSITGAYTKVESTAMPAHLVHLSTLPYSSQELDYQYSQQSPEN